MAKQLIEKNKSFKVVGTLEKNDLGQFYVVISDKDYSRQFMLEDILNEMTGTEISLTSVENLTLDE